MRSFFKRRNAAPPDPPPPTASSSLATKTFPAGIKQLYSPDKATVDIIFIHGLTGDREKTWTAAGAIEPWPTALLPLELPTARVLTFGYDASVADFRGVVSTSRIGNHAWNLLTSLASYREKDDTNERPIIFVCHSLGGLVCEDALVKSKERSEEHLQNILCQTRAIVFLGTPHHGSGLAKWARLLSQFVGIIKQTNTDIIRALNRDSEVLARIQDSFHTMVMARKQEGLEPIQFTCFYEELPLPGVGLIVPKDSAVLPGYVPIGIRRNHMEMTKFLDVEDPGFIAICAELRRWIKDIGDEEGRRATLSSRGEVRAAIGQNGQYQNQQGALTVQRDGDRTRQEQGGSMAELRLEIFKYLGDLDARRTAKIYRCFRCDTPGHLLPQCYASDETVRRGMKARRVSGRCFNCGLQHWQRDCRWKRCFNCDWDHWHYECPLEWSPWEWSN